MSLLHCPECGHEISENAVACPNCGRPTGVGERKVVVMENPRETTLPAWALIPVALVGLILLFVMYLVWDRNSEDNANIRVNTNLARQPVTQQNIPSSSAPSSI